MKQFLDAGSNTRGVPFFERGDQADVVGHREMRKKSRFLNNVADAAAETDGIPSGGGAAFDEDLPAGGDEHAIDEAEERGLAAAAAAEENESLAGRNGQRDIRNKFANGGNRRARGGSIDLVGDAAELDGGVRRGCGFRIHFD